MKVIEHLATTQRPLVSVEIIPPKRGSSFLDIQNAIESILPFHPPFIDITSHAAEIMWEEMPDGTYRRRVKRKSPGTFGLCAAIKYKFNIDPVPHLLCNGFTREETEDALIELHYLGVENLLLIRGDSETKKNVPEGRSINRHAIELVNQVAAMNRGQYLDQLLDAGKTDFCVGVAAYPEKHFEAPNLAFDLDQLKKKQEAGAHYAVTQLFYDNAQYHAFVKHARAAGITLPIIPGLKILTRKSQLTSIPKVFFINFPNELVAQVMAAKDDHQVQQIGIEWAYRQSLDLLDSGAKSLHYYIMQNTGPFVKLMDLLKKHV